MTPTRPRLPAVSIAIVHDYFTQQGGAERVVGEFVRLLPGAAVYTSVFDPTVLPDGLAPDDVRASRLQGLLRLGLPLASLAPILPPTFGRLSLDGAGLVISSTSGFAHQVRPRDGAVHVAYMHTPPHFLWEPDAYFAGRRIPRSLLGPMLSALRRADLAAVARVDGLVANSGYTAERIRRDYGREATVIHPPVDTERFAPTPERSGRFLVVARLRRHKRLELALEAARRSGWPLDIIGDGPDEAFLRSNAGPAVRFLGRLDDRAVADAMARTTALVVPGTEDFGLTMVETQAAGRPVVAFARGGALEIVDDGSTGYLFDDDTPDALVAAMARARADDLDPEPLVASASRFGRPAFDATFVEYLSRAVRDGR